MSALPSKEKEENRDKRWGWRAHRGRLFRRGPPVRRRGLPVTLVASWCCRCGLRVTFLGVCCCCATHARMPPTIQDANGDEAQNSPRIGPGSTGLFRGGEFLKFFRMVFAESGAMFRLIFLLLLSKSFETHRQNSHSKIPEFVRSDCHTERSINPSIFIIHPSIRPTPFKLPNGGRGHTTRPTGLAIDTTTR